MKLFCIETKLTIKKITTMLKTSRTIFKAIEFLIIISRAEKVKYNLKENLLRSNKEAKCHRTKPFQSLQTKK